MTEVDAKTGGNEPLYEVLVLTKWESFRGVS